MRLDLFKSRQGIDMVTVETGPTTRSHPCVVTPEEAQVIEAVAARARKAPPLDPLPARSDETELAMLREELRGRSAKPRKKQK